MWLLLGGGIGYERILLFIPVNGQIWCPLLPSCSVNFILLLVGLGFLRILRGLMRNSEKPGFLIFVVLGQRETSLEEFAHEVDGWLPLLHEVSSPGLTGEVLAEVLWRKGVTAGSLDGWGWRELKALPVSWCDGLARILSQVEADGFWPEEHSKAAALEV